MFEQFVNVTDTHIKLRGTKKYKRHTHRWVVCYSTMRFIVILQLITSNRSVISAEVRNAVAIHYVTYRYLFNDPKLSAH